MNLTSKSPRTVLLIAMDVARRTLPAYAHRCSPKKFTQHQLFACLVLKAFCRTDYRGIVVMLSEWSDLREAIGLKEVPHFTTLQKAAARLLLRGEANRLLEATLACADERSSPRLTAADSRRVTSAPTSCVDAIETSNQGVSGRPRLTSAIPSSVWSPIARRIL